MSPIKKINGILTRPRAKHIWNSLDIMSKVELIKMTTLVKTWSNKKNGYIYSQDVNSSHSWNQIGYKNQSAVKYMLEKTYGILPTSELYNDLLAYKQINSELEHNKDQVKICKSIVRKIMPKVRGYV
jgi:hypothetical protein